MKKTTYLLLTCLAFYSISYAQYTVIPDSNFEQELINLGIDSEGILDNQILTSDANSQQGNLVLINKGISDLTGIEAFTSITGLNFSYNVDIDSVDLTNCTLLQTVEGTGCSSLTSINLIGLTNLTTIRLPFASLLTLDVNTNVALKELNLRGNQLSSLDLTQNSVIDQVDVKSNALTFLDLRNGNCANMIRFDADYNSCLKCLFIDDVTDPNLWDHNYWIMDNQTTPVQTEADCANVQEIPEEFCPALGVNPINKMSFTMFPNPVNSTLHIAIKEPKAILNICSMTGKIILTENLHQSENVINVSSLATGMYLARIESDKGIETKKLIVK
ncbi:MAG TPA: T9SS type A sorting domain-containing protein [Xanthomarina sp.]|nr:T9SS type A sorting domain-containing protein [Xanthomarina sp.]